MALTKSREIYRFMVIIFGMTAAISGFHPGPSSALNEGDLEKLTSTGVCRECDLRMVNLAGKDLSGGNLSGSVLIGANLRRANLSGANLSQAVFVDAVLSGANLSGADLSGADLNGAYMFDVNLSGADLSEAIWTNGVKCRKGSIGKCE